MSKKPVTILEHLIKALERKGEKVEDIEALLIGSVEHHYSEQSKMYRQPEDIHQELIKPYANDKYATVPIPDFFAWTKNHTYFLYRSFQPSGDGNSDSYLYEAGAIPRNPTEMYPEYIFE
jgi:hypothetical protein